MRFSELPGFPALFSDFAAQRGPITGFLPGFPTPEKLVSTAGNAALKMPHKERICQILRNQAAAYRSSSRPSEAIKRLQNTATAVILANVPVRLFGGCLSALWTCVTLLKITEELAQAGLTAVPILNLTRQPDEAMRSFSLNILDDEGQPAEIGQRGCAGIPSGPAEDIRIPDEITEYVRQLGRLLGRNADEELIGLLGKCYQTGLSMTIATGTFLSNLFDEWDLVILDSSDPEFLDASQAAGTEVESRASEIAALQGQMIMKLQQVGYLGNTRAARGTAEADRSLYRICSVLPVACCIMDPDWAQELVLSQAVFSVSDLPWPVIFPRFSATLMDARSRHILERHKLSLLDLFAGPAEIIMSLEAHENTGRASRDLVQMEQETRKVLSKVGDLLGPADKMHDAVKDSEGKILYQLARLRERLESASGQRLKASERQITRACNMLSPSRDLQERQLAMVYFLCRFSRGLIRVLEKTVDIWKFEHLSLPVD